MGASGLEELQEVLVGATLAPCLGLEECRLVAGTCYRPFRSNWTSFRAEDRGSLVREEAARRHVLDQVHHPSCKEEGCEDPDGVGA